MKFFLLLFLAPFWTVKLSAQEGPRPADEILQQAYTQAAKEHKNVLVIFHASWCGWCHKMDSSLNDRSVKAFFDKNFVITHLTISENPDKKMQENPGGEVLFNKYGGNDNTGIPYWLVFDRSGKLLADSRLKEGPHAGDNIGCPSTKEEVDYLIDVLKKTSSITPEQIAAVEKRFRKNE